MKNILILASGMVANHFIQRVSKNRVADNHYYVMYTKIKTLPQNLNKNITLIKSDPTSFLHIKEVMFSTSFSSVFIIIKTFEEAKYALKNITLINKKIRIILVNQWGETELGKAQENITTINSASVVAGYLYDQLPNVPLVAQNLGLGKGEIMEVHIPFASSYAYRHIGSIDQSKWKIASIYRQGKQILPTTATMIRPNDTLLIVGQPIVLNGVYRTINKKVGLFPEPFGKHIYLILDFRFDGKEALAYVQEALYLIKMLKDKSLFIRLLYPNDFALIKAFRQLQANSENVYLFVSYRQKDIEQTIKKDIDTNDIGLVMATADTVKNKQIQALLYEVKKLLYIFGKASIQSLKKSVVLMDEGSKMESISSSAFDISHMLKLQLLLADFNPEALFQKSQKVVEHYETLKEIFDIQMKFEQKTANPIRELSKMPPFLQIASFEKELNTQSYKKLFSARVEDFILTTTTHPKLLVPFALDTQDTSSL